MKKSIIYSIFSIITIIFSINFIGACSTTESENVKTSGIWAHYRIVENTDGEIYGYAVLRVGGNTGTMVDLVGDDTVECNGVKLTEYVEPITNYRWNRAQVSEDPDNLYDFTFYRVDEEVTTTLELPAPPFIETLSATELYDGDDLTIGWDNSSPGDYVDISLTGVCINDVNQISLEDDGEYTFSNITMMDTTQETDCDVNIKISRIYEQDINSAFQGGQAEGISKDASSVRIFSDPVK
ncbi:MAG: hypothetical protein ACQES9_00565 [Myxococcota bacterium]